MNKYTSLIIIFIISVMINCNKNFVSQEMYVSSDSGLILREKPNQESKNIFLIPYGTQLITISKTNFNSTIQTKNGPLINNWFEVKYKGLTGWVFGGFLLSKDDFSKHKFHELICSFIENPYIGKYNLPKTSDEENNSIKNLLLKEFGPSIDQTTNYEKSIHNLDKTNTLITLKFLNNEFIIMQIYESQRQLLDHLKISNDNDKLKYNIDFKKSKNEIIKIFGKPDLNKNNTLRFVCEKGYPDLLEFHFTNNKIDNITIDYYID